MPLTMAQWFLYWTAYSFMGWAWETMLSVVLRRRFEDRGMLNGPICPIYGFGALLVLLLLHDVRNPLALFLASGVVACTLEYLSSWVIEKLYHVRFWDYTGKPFNINGRVYLNGFLAFGFGAAAVVLVVQPWMTAIVESWPELVVLVVAAVLCVATAADWAITLAGLHSFDSRLARVGEQIRMRKLEQIEAIDTHIDMADEMLTRSLNWQQRRLVRIFPGLISLRNPDIVKGVRELLERQREHMRKGTK
ncbi:putative ABC transporter permease [Bifidobacterium saguinibicoloris]|uniref:putative ABC transporter permease n=1 Tax=Bifidobacterium saguinibicoloris TaxID=2834433 RepID=UPI001C5A4407|nr:putative ABC transporter permease [Bifidobacterium saguinibicoloris]MBW3081522.1 putative ABC transporter permease [Bifidobacterium saguinibicoloris]